MKIYVIDVETTGLDPASDRVVEIAAIEICTQERPGGWDWVIGDGVRSFVNPRVPIPPEASGIHHILDADVVDAPDLGEAIDRVLTPMWPQTVEICAAHNARLDRGFLLPLKEKQWLDTWRCGMHVWPDAPSFANCSLFYFLGCQRPDNVAPHSALFDVTVTAHILCRLLKERTVDELLKLSTKACVLKKVGFGKHFGNLWTEVPYSYLEWGAKQDFDPDVKFTIRHEIRRRDEIDAAVNRAERTA